MGETDPRWADLPRSSQLSSRPTPVNRALHTDYRLIRRRRTASPPSAKKTPGSDCSPETGPEGGEASLISHPPCKTKQAGLRRSESSPATTTLERLYVPSALAGYYTTRKHSCQIGGRIFFIGPRRAVFSGRCKSLKRRALSAEGTIGNSPRREPWVNERPKVLFFLVCLSPGRGDRDPSIAPAGAPTETAEPFCGPFASPRLTPWAIIWRPFRGCQNPRPYPRRSGGFFVPLIVGPPIEYRHSAHAARRQG